MLNILTLYQDLTHQAPEKASTTNGGEYHGPCPACGGRDRFHVWPEQRYGGTYWCRGCGKAGKQELFTYKTLKLVLPSKARNGSEDQSPSGERVRIHLCRGHFKHFTKDAPLFGRHTGLYWWQPQLRGDKTKGMVAKDYEVTAR